MCVWILKCNHTALQGAKDLHAHHQPSNKSAGLDFCSQQDTIPKLRQRQPQGPVCPKARMSSETFKSFQSLRRLPKLLIQHLGQRTAHPLVCSPGTTICRPPAQHWLSSMKYHSCSTGLARQSLRAFFPGPDQPTHSHTQFLERKNEKRSGGQLSDPFIGAPTHPQAYSPLPPSPVGPICSRIRSAQRPSRSHTCR